MRSSHLGSSLVSVIFVFSAFMFMLCTTLSQESTVKNTEKIFTVQKLSNSEPDYSQLHSSGNWFEVDVPESGIIEISTTASSMMSHTGCNNEMPPVKLKLCVQDTAGQICEIPIITPGQHISGVQVDSLHWLGYFETKTTVLINIFREKKTHCPTGLSIKSVFRPLDSPLIDIRYLSDPIYFYGNLSPQLGDRLDKIDLLIFPQDSISVTLHEGRKISNNSSKIHLDFPGLPLKQTLKKDGFVEIKVGNVMKKRITLEVEANQQATYFLQVLSERKNPNIKRLSFNEPNISSLIALEIPEPDITQLFDTIVDIKQVVLSCSTSQATNSISLELYDAQTGETQRPLAPKYPKTFSWNVVPNQQYYLLITSLDNQPFSDSLSYWLESDLVRKETITVQLPPKIKTIVMPSDTVYTDGIAWLFIDIVDENSKSADMLRHVQDFFDRYDFSERELDLTPFHILAARKYITLRYEKTDWETKAMNHLGEVVKLCKQVNNKHKGKNCSELLIEAKSVLERIQDNVLGIPPNQVDRQETAEKKVKTLNVEIDKILKKLTSK